MELITGLINTSDVVGIDHEYEPLSVMEIMPPKGADSILPADVPYVKVEPFVLNSLDIEPNRRDRRHMFPELQLVKNSRLTGSIKAKHETAGLAIPKPLLVDVAEEETHLSEKPLFGLYTAEKMVSQTVRPFDLPDHFGIREAPRF
jgi:hypothetical protein